MSKFQCVFNGRPIHDETAVSTGHVVTVDAETRTEALAEIQKEYAEVTRFCAFATNPELAEEPHTAISGVVAASHE